MNEALAVATARQGTHTLQMDTNMNRKLSTESHTAPCCSNSVDWRRPRFPRGRPSSFGILALVRAISPFWHQRPESPAPTGGGMLFSKYTVFERIQ